MNFWLVKQEPSKYNWERLLKDQETCWDGVRNYQARNNMKLMRRGDLVLFYHSVVGKEVKGICTVSREAYPDPTTDDTRWCVVDLKPVKAMQSPVTLDDIKSRAELNDLALVRQSRLSVMPLTKKEFKILLKMGNTSLSGV